MFILLSPLPYQCKNLGCYVGESVFLCFDKEESNLCLQA